MMVVVNRSHARTAILRTRRRLGDLLCGRLSACWPLGLYVGAQLNENPATKGNHYARRRHVVRCCGFQLTYILIEWRL